MDHIRESSIGRDTTISGADATAPRRSGTKYVPRAELRRRRSNNGENSISLLDMLQSRGRENITLAVRAAVQRSEEVQGLPMLITGGHEGDEDQTEAIKFNQRDYDNILERTRPQEQPQRRRQHVRGQQPTRQQPSRQQLARGKGKQPAVTISSSSSESDDEVVEELADRRRSTVRAGKLPAIKLGIKRKRGDTTAETADGGEDELPKDSEDKEGSEQSAEVADDEEDEANAQTGRPSRESIRAGKLPRINKNRSIKRKRDDTAAESGDDDLDVKVEGEVEDEAESDSDRPTTRPSRAKKTKEDPEHELDNASGRRVFCFCRMGESDFMIGCDGCGEWFHGYCVSVSKERGKALAFAEIPWYCSLCKPVPYHEPAPIIPVTRQEVWRAIPPEGITIWELAAMFYERIEKTQGPDGWRQTVCRLIRQADEGEYEGEAGDMRVVRREIRARTTNDKSEPSTATGEDNDEPGPLTAADDDDDDDDEPGSPTETGNATRDRQT